MKMKSALDIIYRNRGGYMVSFEWLEGKLLRGDYFPEKHSGEHLIATQEEAWELATNFANKTIGDVVNVRVVDSRFRSVEGFRCRLIKNR